MCKHILSENRHLRFLGFSAVQSSWPAFELSLFKSGGGNSRARGQDPSTHPTQPMNYKRKRKEKEIYNAVVKHWGFEILKHK